MKGHFFFKQTRTEIMKLYKNCWTWRL